MKKSKTGIGPYTTFLNKPVSRQAMPNSKQAIQETSKFLGMSPASLRDGALIAVVLISGIIAYKVFLNPAKGPNEAVLRQRIVEDLRQYPVNAPQMPAYPMQSNRPIDNIQPVDTQNPNGYNVLPWSNTIARENPQRMVTNNNVNDMPAVGPNTDENGSDIPGINLTPEYVYGAMDETYDFNPQ